MALNLGDVTIGLVADTRGLQAAMDRLKVFGQAVNAVARKTDETSQRITQAFARQEKVLSQTFTKIDTQVANLRRVKADPQIIAQLTNQYRNLQESLTKGERSSIEVARAQEYGTRILNRANNAIKDYTAAQTLATTASEKLATAQRRIGTANAAVQRSLGSLKAQPYIAANNEALAAYEAHLKSAGLTTNSLKTATAQLATSLQNNRAAWQKVSDAVISASKARAAYAAAENRVRNLQQRMSSMGTDPTTVALIQRADVALEKHAATLRKNTLTASQMRNSNTQLAQSLGQISREWNALTQSVRAADAAERARERATRVSASLNRQLRITGAPQSYQQDVSNTLRQYEAALRGSNLARITATQNAWKAAVDRGRAAMTGAGGAASKFAGSLRDVGRSLILVVGPLSGVGARVAVLSTLFETLSWKMAIGVGGFTALTVGFGALTAAGVKATIMMEQWHAQMLLASGAESLIASNFEYMTTFANQMGQSVQRLVPEYSKFAAAARMTNMSLEDQRAAFEAIITAGTALRSTPDEVGRMFLAMEQMISKGTVMTEEIKRQLGDVLPGAVQLGAQAMGVSTSKFIDMMRKNEIAANDFVKKFSVLLKDLFGPAAIKGAQSLQAEIARTGNEWLLFKMKLDETIKTSEGFRRALKGFNELLQSMQSNVPTLVAGFGGFIGVIIGLGASFLITAKRVSTLISTVTALRAAFLSFNAVAAGSALLTLIPGVGTLIRLGVVAGSAALGYYAMSKAISSASASSDTFQEALKADVELYEKLGAVAKNVSDEVLKNAQIRIEAATTEVAAVIKAQDELKKRSQETANLLAETGMLPGFMQRRSPPVSGEAKELEERRKRLQTYIDDMEALVARWQNIKVTKDTIFDPEDPAGDGGKAAANAFKKRLQDMIDEYQAAKNKMEIVARGGSLEEFLNEDAVRKVASFLRDMPKGVSEQDIKTEIFRRLGIEANTAAEALNKMFLATKLFGEQASDFNNWATSAASRIDSFVNAIDQYNERLGEAGGASSSWTKKQVAAFKELQKEADRFDNLFKFSALKDNADVFEETKKRYLDFIKTVQDAEFSSYWKEEMEKVARSTGIAMESVTVKFDNAIDKINEGILSGFVDQIKGGVLIGKIEMERFKKIVEEQLEPFKELTGAIQSWADQTTDVLANLIVNGTKDWSEQIKQLGNTIVMDVNKLIIKRGIVDPIMGILFGDLSGRDNKTGALGSLGGGFMNMVFGKEGQLGYGQGGVPYEKVNVDASDGVANKLGDGIFGGFMKGLQQMGTIFMDFLSGLVSVFSVGSVSGGSGGGLSGFFGNIFGSIFGGNSGASAAATASMNLGSGMGLGSGMYGGLADLIPGLAQGGPAYAGQLYQVAENEPELYTVGNKSYLLPRSNGFVEPLEPSSRDSQGQLVKVYAPITVYSQDAQSFRRSESQLANMIGQRLNRGQRIS